MNRLNFKNYYAHPYYGSAQEAYKIPDKEFEKLKEDLLKIPPPYPEESIA
jgi:hypothetical protein